MTAAPAAGAALGTLPRRRLGRSPVEVTELSFGAAALGNLYTEVSDDDARAAVDAAWDGGIRYFDTAPHYGLGLSERRVGAALRGRPRDEYALSTKVGRILEPGAPGGRDEQGFDVAGGLTRRFDFSADGVRRSLADSLERLGLDRVDLALIHDPDDHEEQAFREAYPALEKLRAEGVVRAIGAGMNQSAMLARFVRDTDVDAVLLAGRYTLLDRSAAAGLLPAAAERGVSVIAGGVFNSGILADPGASATYDYAAAPEALVRRARALEERCVRFRVPLRAAAARFPLTCPAVATVLLGLRSPAEVSDALAMRALSVPDGLWDALAASDEARAGQDGAGQDGAGQDRAHRDRAGQSRADGARQP
ncbi:MAG TPA: aldo/keto reductase [Trebonia sp.]|nr:aldo/keto reductase [Trebonia sp.]